MSAPTVAHPALTPRQTAVLTAIRDHTARHGYAPSTREIGAAAGMSSTSSVLHHLRSLHDRGLLFRGVMGRRAVALTDLARETLAGPVVSDDEARAAGAAAFERMASALEPWEPELARSARTWAHGIQHGSATAEWAAAVRALLTTPTTEENHRG